MIFFPFKVDIQLARIPFLTILVSIICLVIYWQQVTSNQSVINYVDSFCAEQKGRNFKLIMKKLAGDIKADEKEVCAHTISSVHFSREADKVITDMAGETSAFSSMTLERTHEFIADYLHKKYNEFSEKAPVSLTTKLWYDPTTLNLLNMVSSVFSHGSWSHVIGNLFFFFAFAAAVELILGSLVFMLIILVLAMGTNMAYAVAVATSAINLPTLGLSGVVMGMIGLFVYFIPAEKIRCFFWLLIYVRKFSVPAWILALWYFGWDLYGLFTVGNGTGVNLVAHVSGFIIGYLIGVVFFKSRKQELLEEIRQRKHAQDMNIVMKKLTETA